MSSTGTVRRIGILGFDGVAAIDLVGALDAFYIAGGNDWRKPSQRYATTVIGISAEPFQSESGIQFVPHTTLHDTPPLDTIIVPGGPGLREENANAMAAEWLRSRSHTRRIVSVCTGIYGLAASGLLDGRRATTHWEFAAHVQRRFPNVRIEPDAIFVRDGKFYSSAGMTAGIDLALSLIEEDHGAALALSTARQLVVYMKRSGGQLQYSEPLRFQAQAGDRLNALVAKIVGNLAADWSVEEMATETGLSSRQFARRFRAAFGVTPAMYIERLRLDEGRLRLASGREKVATIAYSVGFSSDDAFRRAFERRFGIAPSLYRARFTGHGTEEYEHDQIPIV